MKYKSNLETVNAMTLLPPRKDVCQECAVKHDPTQPHAADSLYYGVKYKMEKNQEPSWLTAMAHCSDEIKKIWTEELTNIGIDVAAGHIYPRKEKKNEKLEPSK